MRQKMKRVCASLLTASMIVTSLSSAAFAEDTPTTEGWTTDHSAYFYQVGEEWKKAPAERTETEPTCTEAGTVTYTVDVDGVAPYVEAGKPATGHSSGAAVKENEVAPGCKANGSYDEVTYCTVCNEELSRTTQTVPATGHTASEAVEEKRVEPTCTEDGSYEVVVYCSVCGDEISRNTEQIPATGEHDWELTETVKEPTCTEDGEGEYVCTVCGETKTDAIEATGHVEGEPKTENLVEATCTEEGSYDAVVRCTVCDEILSEEHLVTEATGHDWDEGEVTKEATCGEDGEMTYTCKACGETKTEAIEATGEHTPGDWELVRDNTFVDSTCTKEGNGTYVKKCTECDEILESENRPIEKKDHEFEQTKVIKEPTCTEEGEAEVTCVNCGETSTEVIEATGRTPGEAVQENVVAATCTEDGSYDEVVYCTVCGEELSRETKTAGALGHDWVKDEEASVAATCTEAGKDVFKCSRCEETDEKEVEAAGHKYVKDEDVSREATCAREGAYVEICSVCGDVHKETTEKLPHKPGEPVQENVVEATCTSEGSYDEVVYCTECKEELSREAKTIDMLEHEYEDVAGTAKEATCTEEGRTADQKCKVCEAVKEGEVIEALGHDWKEEKPIKKETCEEEGQYYAICSRCGEVDKDITHPALGHDYVKTDAVISWNADKPSEGFVEYTYTCKNDASHTKTEIVNFTAEDEDKDYTVTSEVTTEPACLVPGERTYTFSETIDGKEVTSTNTEVIDALEHKPAEPVKENEKEATCTEGGSYESVVYCSLCGEELKRDTIQTSAKGHTPGEAVIENEQNKDSDTEDYTYDSVIYCTVCGEELSRDQVTVPATGHKPGDPVEENRVEPTCTEAGSYEVVVYCTEDNEELSREKFEIPAKGHTEGDAQIENEIEATCTEDGSYDLVVRCKDCNEILSTEHKTTPATGHTEYVRTDEVVTEATATSNGTIADVVYCSKCHEFIRIVEGTEKVVPSSEVKELAEKAKEAANKVDPAAYPEDQQEAVKAAKEALLDAAKDPNVTANELNEKKAALDAAVDAAEKAAKEDAAEAAAKAYDEAKAEADKAAEAAAEAKKAADAAEAGTQEAVDAAKAAEEAAKTAAEKAEAAKTAAAAYEEAAKNAYGAGSDEAAAAKEAAANAETAAKDAATAAQTAAAATKTAEEAKADADKKAAADEAAKAYEAAKAEADKAAEAAAEAKKTADAAKPGTQEAVDAAKAAEEAAKTAAEKAEAAKTAAAAYEEAAKAAYGEDSAEAAKAKEAAANAETAAKNAASAANTASAAAKTAESAKAAADKAKAEKDPKLTSFKAKKKVKAGKKFKIKAAADSKGKITFKKLSGNKKIKVSANGTVKVKKGLKKGKYKVKIQITVAANGDYKARTFTKTIKIRVK